VPATWKVGVLTVPGSTGSVAVTGLGGTPAAVFFFGTNWTTEDSAVTSSGTGLFRGMAAPKYDSPSTIVQSCGTIIPAGDAQYHLGARSIAMLDTSGGLTFIYTALVTSFDSDGFTVDWDTAPGGGYKVVYVALMGVANVGAFRGTTNQSGLAFGFKAGASLMHGVWGTGDAGGNVANNDRTQNWYGGAAYPGGSSSGWMSAGMSAFCTQGSGSTLLELSLDTPNIRVVTGGHGGIAGTFVSSDINASPTGGGLTNLTFQGDGDDSGMIVAWDDEDSATGTVTIPDNEDDATTVSGLSFEPGLLIGYSISDEPDGTANYGAGNGRGANGFSIVTPDFQWTALVDGVSSRGAYQSFQRGFCDRVSGTSVHAGTVELTTDGFVMTAVEDDLDVGSFIWHAFGHPTPFPWIPQLRRHHAGGGRPVVIVVETDYVLLEDGSLILLEDGSGALLL
jgi:hypothetical protein